MTLPYGIERLLAPSDQQLNSQIYLTLDRHERSITSSAMPTKWLDDDEQAAWRSYLMTSQLLFEALDRQMQRDAGMPHAYYILLAMLSEQPDRALTMSQLARIVGYSPSRLSHAVARLEEQGWVRRTRHPGGPSDDHPRAHGRGHGGRQGVGPRTRRRGATHPVRRAHPRAGPRHYAPSTTPRLAACCVEATAAARVPGSEEWADLCRDEPQEPLDVRLVHRRLNDHSRGAGIGPAADAGRHGPGSQASGLRSMCHGGIWRVARRTP